MKREPLIRERMSELKDKGIRDHADCTPVIESARYFAELPL